MSSGSEQAAQRNQKRVLPLGTAETKKLARKGKGQQKTRKRKAEGLNGIVQSAVLLSCLHSVLILIKTSHCHSIIWRGKKL